MSLKELWPGWETVRKIGSGGYGAVYEIRKKDGTGEYRSALKVMRVPQGPDEYQSYVDDGYDEKSITTIFRSRIDELVSEFRLMSQFKGTSNIVSYEDHMITEHEDGRGWDILIRMELLKSLPVYYNEKGKLEEEEAVRLGEDICRALELCGKKDIVHRDIKPQNIFVNEFGDFKLGDFGISKTMEHTTKATKAGTFGYMAPEVYHNRPYGPGADQYSLGLVLYWLMNERRLPFQPLPPEVPTAAQNAEAQERRMEGEALPKPAHASGAFAEVILKACSADPAGRYAGPAEFREALEAVRLGGVPAHGRDSKEPKETGEQDGAGAEDKTALRCGNCGATITPKTARCPECGTYTGITVGRFDEICPHCGSVTPKGKERCISCGRKLVEEKPKAACAKCGKILPEGVTECPYCAAEEARRREEEAKRLREEQAALAKKEKQKKQLMAGGIGIGVLIVLVAFLAGRGTGKGTGQASVQETSAQEISSAAKEASAVQEESSEAQTDDSSKQPSKNPEVEHAGNVFFKYTDRLAAAFKTAEIEGDFTEVWSLMHELYREADLDHIQPGRDDASAFLSDAGDGGRRIELIYEASYTTPDPGFYIYYGEYDSSGFYYNGHGTWSFVSGDPAGEYENYSAIGNWENSRPFGPFIEYVDINRNGYHDKSTILSNVLDGVYDERVDYLLHETESQPEDLFTVMYSDGHTEILDTKEMEDGTKRYLVARSDDGKRGFYFTEDEITSAQGIRGKRY